MPATRRHLTEAQRQLSIDRAVWFHALIHARDHNKADEIAEARAQLSRLGVRVRFTQPEGAADVQ